MVTVDAKQTMPHRTAGTLPDGGMLRAQQEWYAKPVSDRVACIRKFRYAIATHAEELAAHIELPQRGGLAESLAAEIMPLADACRFLERNAVKLLRPRHAAAADRPAWGRGLKVTVHREPVGTVLVIGTWNYPLFLTGVQTLQAIAAGNAVLIKPGAGTTKLTTFFRELLVQSGMPGGLVGILPEDPEQAQQVMDSGVGKVVFTGSAKTGKQVLERMSHTATPGVMELSGSDAVFVMPDADLSLAAKCVAFGLRINGSSTCIAPRRILVNEASLPEFRERLRDEISGIPAAQVHPAAGKFAAELVQQALQAGAELVAPEQWRGWASGEEFPATVLQLDKPRLSSTNEIGMELLRSDVFAPVTSLIPVTDMEEALCIDTLCPYALGATVFGTQQAAERLARRIDAGCVVINDMIAPTADPRVPFGGRNESGFGVTRGAEGLLEMTQIKTVVTQTSGWLPHLDRPIPELGPLLLGFLKMNHSGTWRERWQAMQGLMNSGRAWWNANRKGQTGS